MDNKSSRFGQRALKTEIIGANDPAILSSALGEPQKLQTETAIGPSGADCQQLLKEQSQRCTQDNISSRA
jgi:hypothetical protein